MKQKSVMLFNVIVFGSLLSMSVFAEPIIQSGSSCCDGYSEIACPAKISVSMPSKNYAVTITSNMESAPRTFGTSDKSSDSFLVQMTPNNAETRDTVCFDWIAVYNSPIASTKALNASPMSK